MYSEMNNSPETVYQNVGYEMDSESVGETNPVTAVPSIASFSG